MCALSLHDRRFGARLSGVRRLRQRSQDDLAAAVGMTRPSLSEAERQRRKVSVGEAFLLCRELGVDLSEMLADAPLVLRHEIPVD